VRRSIAAPRDALPGLPGGTPIHFAGGAAIAPAGGSTPAGYVPGTGVASAPASGAQTAYPFAQASKVAYKSPLSVAFTPGAAQIPYGPVPLTSSGGYLKRLILEAIAASGAGGSPVFQPDGPWTFFANVQFLQPNNAPILNLTGWNLLMADIYGGYAGVNDPRNDPDYLVTGAGALNPNFAPFIPIEIDPTGVGALTDLSNANGYQLGFVIGTSAQIWSTAPTTTIPTVTVTVDQEYWTLPAPAVLNPTSGAYVPQATKPPNAGTIQLWNQVLNTAMANGGQISLTRTGRQLRTIILVGRSAAARAEGVVPAPLNLIWDDVNMYTIDLQFLRKKMKETVNGLTLRDTGVYTFAYNTGVSRFAGGAGVASYWPTVAETKYQIQGSNTASTPTVDWVVNEVTSAPTSAAERASQQAGMRYTPPSAQPAGAQ
jgi:hypothetical protein